MGCDIHVAIEYRHPELGMQPFITGGAFVPRDYRLFGALAGVRLPAGAIPPIAPRGVPADASGLIRNQFSRVVVADDQPEYMSMGYNVVRKSTIGSDATETHPGEHLGTAEWHNDPDLHHVSYLSLTEISICLQQQQIDLDELSAEFRCLLDCLAAINFRFKGDVSRLVFGFDN